MSTDKTTSMQPHSKPQPKWVINDHRVKNQFIQKIHTISWTIDDKLKQAMKSSPNNTVFRSISDEEQKTDDVMFVIVAKSTRTNIQFFIAINNYNNLNLNMASVEVQYTLKCWELNLNQANKIIFDQNHLDSSTQKTFGRTKLRKCKANTITIHAEIELINISEEKQNTKDTRKTIDKQWDNKTSNDEYEKMKKQLIAIGFINDTHRNFPRDLKNLCFGYYFDGLRPIPNIIQNTIRISWVLDDEKLIQCIISSPNGMFCKSHSIHACNIDWRLFLFPNGRKGKDAGSFVLVVKACGIPQRWTAVTMCITAQCQQTMSKYTSIVTFDRLAAAEYDIIGLISTQEIKAKHLTTMTFTVFIEILRIKTKKQTFKFKSNVLYQIKCFKYASRHTIKWNIDRNLMSLMKKSRGTCFESNNYGQNALKQLWCLRCTNTGTQFNLQMISVPSDIRSLKVKYKIYCMRVDDGIIECEWSNIHTFCCVEPHLYSKHVILMPFNRFANFDELVICADIQIMNVYNIEKHDIASQNIVRAWSENIYKWKNKVFSTTYEWIVSAKQLKWCSTGTADSARDRILSDVLRVGNLKFMAEVARNGVIKLTVLTMPKEWKRFYVSVMIECNLHRSFIIIMFDVRAAENICDGLFIKRVLKHVLYTHLYTFTVNITLLKIERNLKLLPKKGKSKGIKVLYQMPSNNCKRRESVRWEMNNFMLERIKMMNDGEINMDKNVGSNFKMWSLKIINNATLGLLLCLQLNFLCANVSKLQVQITYLCDYNSCTDNKVTKVEEFFYSKKSYQKVCGEPVCILSVKQIKEIDGDALITFGADIVVLHEYDTNGEDVIQNKIENDWKQFADKNNEYDIDDTIELNHDQLDERTKFIVYGYLRNLQPANSNIGANINVFYICLSYVFDFFMKSCGKYIWDIKNINVMNTIAGEHIASNVFYLAQLPWKIVLYPNGINNNNINSLQCGLMLLSVAMAESWKSISGILTIECEQTESKQMELVQFTHEQSTHFWSNGQLQRQKVINLQLKQITFVVSFKIIQILSTENKLFYEPKLNASYPKNMSIKWNIDNKLMNKMKNCGEGESFPSKAYHNMWYLCVSPNGFCNNIKGDVMLELCLYSLPKNISRFRVQFKLFCSEARVMDTNIEEFSYNKGRTKSCWQSNTFSFKNFRAYKNITFCADIAIILEYDIWGKGRALQQAVHGKGDNEMKHEMQLLKDEVSDLSQKVDKLANVIQLLTSTDNNIMDMRLQTSEQQTLYAWLSRSDVKLEQYYTIFINHGFDELDLLKDITMKELEQIGIAKLGHRKKIIQKLSNLRHF